MKVGYKMNKKRVEFRLNEKAEAHLKEKSKQLGLTKTALIEKLLLEDKKKDIEFVDELANAIYKKLDDRTKSIRIAVNENNKIIKTQQKILNYFLLAQGIKMAYTAFAHPAVVAAEEEVKQEIKRLQVIKADQRKKQEGT